MNKNKWEKAYLGQRRNLWRRERRIKIFNIDRSKSILDYGCGDGLDLIIFRKLGYKKIAGLDHSEDYLSKIRAQFKVYLGDACDTGIPSQSFDAIFIDSALHHFDLPRALKEIRRILKVGGELCFIEPSDTFARKLLDSATLCPLFSFFGYLRKRRITLIEERNIYNNWLKQQPFLLTMLRKFGFRVVFCQKRLITIIVKCVLEEI